MRTGMDYATLLPDYILSSPRPGQRETFFDGIHTFVMFLGIGRSGTTLVGALLDAHPNIVIAREQNALKYLYPLTFSRERIFRLLMNNASDQSDNSNPGGGGYTYAVAGQSQGTSKKIEVIGDKSRSAQAVERLASRPSLIEKLIETTQAQIRFLHVIRNPFDTIARRSLRRRVTLEKISREYFTLTRQTQAIFTRIEADELLRAKRIPLHLEDLIQNPGTELARICENLGVASDQSYLEACSGIVNAKLQLAREHVSWPGQLLDEIHQDMEQISWLKHYSFYDN